MWNELFDLAIKNGIWAVLFTGLFIFVITDTSKRERKYQQTIKDLTSHLGIVKDIKEDVDEIKEYVYDKTNKKSKQKNLKIKKSTSKKHSAKSKNQILNVSVLEENSKCDNAV